MHTNLLLNKTIMKQKYKSNEVMHACAIENLVA